MMVTVWWQLRAWSHWRWRARPEGEVSPYRNCVIKLALVFPKNPPLSHPTIMLTNLFGRVSLPGLPCWSVLLPLCPLLLCARVFVCLYSLVLRSSEHRRPRWTGALCTARPFICQGLLGPLVKEPASQTLSTVGRVLETCRVWPSVSPGCRERGQALQGAHSYTCANLGRIPKPGQAGAPGMHSSRKSATQLCSLHFPGVWEASWEGLNPHWCGIPGKLSPFQNQNKERLGLCPGVPKGKAELK